jgi:crossover junction endodeoxyribonuclease RusA
MSDLRDTTIRLPWPDRALFSNGSHGHWAPKARAKKAARLHAYYLTEASGATVEGDRAIFLRVDFCPPDNRPRDRTNMEAACKAYFDGIADSLGVNDVRFQPIYFVGDPVKGGEVRVRVLTDDAWRAFGQLAARVVCDAADRLEMKEAAE